MSKMKCYVTTFKNEHCLLYGSWYVNKQIKKDDKAVEMLFLK